MTSGIKRIKPNECGHPERKHQAFGMCSSCYVAWRSKCGAGPKATCHTDRAHYGKGLCSLCYQRERRKTHPRTHYRIKKRLEATRYLGNECLCCGEKETKFLSIDHIHGGGGEHRRKRGDMVYTDILNDPKPEKTYQVLCHNCHRAKDYFGGCPHNE